MATTKKKSNETSAAIDYSPATYGSIETMRKRYNRATSASTKLYDLCREDIRFVTLPGAQWDQRQMSTRGNRAMYQFDKLSPHVKQIVNEWRQAPPAGKVRGVEESDTGLAEIMQGLCRNIESVSHAEDARVIALEPAVTGGFGVYRIRTRYSNEDSFDQEICTEPVYNPFAVKFDPSAVKRDRSDGMFAFVEEDMSKEVYQSTYPDKAIDSDFFFQDAGKVWRPYAPDGSIDESRVRIAEYYWKQPTTRRLLALQPPAAAVNTRAPEAQITFEDDLRKRLGNDLSQLEALGWTVIKERKVESYKVMCRLTNGSEWLSEEMEFPSKYIPLIPVWGDITTVDGEDYFQGLVRRSKDQQRLHNVHRTAAIEAVAKAPKAPFIGKLSWIKGFESIWQRANAEDYAFLPIAEGAQDVPQRAAQAEVPVALLQLAQLDNEDIKATTGQYNPSLGAQSSETSGRAIALRRAQGATSTFNYVGNMNNAIRLEYEIYIDMIPRVYDTQRVVRILGADGAEDWKTLYQEVVNPQTGATQVINDISKGKYDVTVSIGPSYATQRLEAVDMWTQLAAQIGSAAPGLAALVTYQVAKNLDLPGSEEVTEALRSMLVAQKMLPPKDGEQPPQPQGPTPEQIAALEKIGADIANKNADTRLKESQAVKSDADAEKSMAEAVMQQIENMVTNGAMAMILQRALAAPGVMGSMPDGAAPMVPVPQAQMPQPPQPNGFAG